MKRISLLLVLILMVVCVCVLSACKSDRTQYCYDEMGLFDAQQVEAINAQGEAIQTKYDIEVLVVTCARYGKTAAETGDSFRAQQGLEGNSIIIKLSLQYFGG